MQDVHPASPPILTGRRDALEWTSEAPALAVGPLAVVEALLKSPASVLRAIREERGTLLRLSATSFVSLAIVGLGVASFSGGLQFLLVPLKLACGVFACAVICLPSLHVFSCLAGATQSLKETCGALLMGVALTGVLLLGFAPIAWLFSQATRSVAFMGALHLAFLSVSCALGLGLVQRTLAAMNSAPIRGLRLWGMLFVLVVLQMSTTLRPLLGEAKGFGLQDRLFFFAHWLSVINA